MSGVRFACQASCGRCCDEPGGIVYLSPMMLLVSPNMQAYRLKHGLNGTLGRPLTVVMSSKVANQTVFAFTSTSKNNATFTKYALSNAKPSLGGEKTSYPSAWEKTKSSCPGIDAEDAILVDGQTIRLNVFSDRTSTKGFREWPVAKHRRKR